MWQEPQFIANDNSDYGAYESVPIITEILYDEFFQILKE